MAAQGNKERAVELLGVVQEHPAADHACWLEGHIKNKIADSLTKLKGQFSPQDYAAALERGRELDLDEVVGELLG